MDRPRAPGALPALILGIVAVLLFSLAGPFAVMQARRAEREMAEHPGVYEGERMVRIGKVLGYIGTAILIIGLVVGIIVGLSRAE